MGDKEPNKLKSKTMSKYRTNFKLNREVKKIKQLYATKKKLPHDKCGSSILIRINIIR